MAIFETFYLMFKSNAKDAIKGNEAVEKSARRTQDSIKETAEETKKLGDAYVKVLETGMQAAASVISFGAIKSGIVNSAKLTDQLGLQAKITGQSTAELLAYRNAVELAGGSAESLDAFVASTTQMFAQMGQQAPKVSEMFRRIYDDVENLPHAVKLDRLARMGVSEDMMPLFLGTREELEKFIEAGERNARINLEQEKASRAFNQELAITGQGFDNFWRTVNENVLPALTSLLKAFNELTSGLSESKSAATSLFAVMVAGAAVLSGGVIGKFLGLAGGAMTGGILGYLLKAASAATMLLGKLAAVGALGYEAVKGVRAIIDPAYREDSLIAKGARTVAGWIDPDVKTMYANKQPTAPRIAKKTSVEEGMKFYMSQGYTRAQAAGIMANEMAESSGNPMARGDGGRAHGLYQWHPDRRARILQNTGIDVSTASAQDQRKAAAWEMKNEAIFKDEEFRSIRDANEAAGYFSRKFERPADEWGEAFKRGQMATGFYSQYAGGSSSNVTVGDVTVNTQATDAAGIASEINAELSKQINYARGTVDNGVQY